MINMIIKAKCSDLISNGVFNKGFNLSKAPGTPHKVHTTSEKKLIIYNSCLSPFATRLIFHLKSFRIILKIHDYVS